MVGIPQLLEEDIQVLDATLKTLLEQTEASVGLIIDRAGFLIARLGEVDRFDCTTIAALASNAFAATQAIASLVQEPQFHCLYHQGENISMLAESIDENCLLVILFKAEISVGAVKYYSSTAISAVSQQLKSAYERDPSSTLDLASVNVADPSGLFKKKTAI